MPAKLRNLIGIKLFFSSTYSHNVLHVYFVWSDSWYFNSFGVDSTLVNFH